MTDETTARDRATYYKAVRPDGTTRGGVRWAVGEVTTHPTSTAMVRNDAATYLSLSVEPAETLIGGEWPCRLLRVEPIGDVIDNDNRPHKRCVLAAWVVEELPAWQALGPNGREVAALIERLERMTPAEPLRVAAAWAAAWDAARDAAWDAARDAAWDAARDAAWAATRDATRDAARAAARAAAWAAAWAAARALVVRDLISDEHYRVLTDPLFSVIGQPETWTVEGTS